MKYLLLLLVLSGCAHNYVVDCYNEKNELVYREHKNWLIHTHDTTQYHKCTVYRADKN